MAQNGEPSQQAQVEAQIEAEKMAQLEDAIQALDTLQRAFVPFIMKMGVKHEQLQEAEGRRAILLVKGLNHQPALRYYFEVSGLSIKRVAPFQVLPNTYIEAPIDTILRVFQKVLEGREDAFSSEWAKGEARIVGARSVHDAVMFSSGFQRFAKLIKRYRQAAGLAGPRV